MSVDIGYLDDERKKLWGEFENSKKKYEEDLLALKRRLDEVATIATNKVIENEATALKAAQSSEANNKKIAELLGQSQDAATKLVEAKKALDEISGFGAECSKLKDQYTKDSALIVDLKTKADASIKEIVAYQEKATKTAEEASAKWTTVNQQAQNIVDLEAGAKTNAAATKASREEAEKNQVEAKTIKEALKNDKDS